jgi:type IV pilus assembly protein PilW
MQQHLNQIGYPKKNQGFTLLELLLALSTGLVLFAGVLSIFVGMRSTTAETSSYGELQENGRFAVSLLTNDLQRQGFWGDFNGTLNTQSITMPFPPILIDNDCVGQGLNNATFMQPIGTFRTLWGQTINQGVDANPLGCFQAVLNTQTRDGSDVIQLKRVIGLPVPGINLNADDVYLYDNSDSGTIFSNNAIPPPLANGRYWQYQHHVYYVRERTVGVDTVPVLMQGRLVSRGMNFNPVIDGIEIIRFMYGIDINGDGNVDNYLSATNVPQNAWDNSGNNNIVAIKLYVLARNIMPDNNYVNNNTYQLGDLQFQANDNFRRLLFSSTVTLHNAYEQQF